MIAEDECALRKLLARTLTLSGYDVVSAVNVGECLEHFRRAHEVGDVTMPSLLVSDVHLPDGTGLHIARGLKPIWEGPVILLTAFCSEATWARAHALGHEILEKPFDITDLTSRIERALPLWSTRISGRATP